MFLRVTKTQLGFHSGEYFPVHTWHFNNCLLNENFGGQSAGISEKIETSILNYLKPVSLFSLKRLELPSSYVNG